MAVVDGDWRWPYRFSEWAPGGLHIFQYRRVPSLSRVCMHSISRSVRSFVFLRSFAVGVLLFFFPQVLQSRQPFAIFFLLPRSVQLFAWRGRNRYNAMSIVRQNVWNIHISCGLIFAFCILCRISNHWFFFLGWHRFFHNNFWWILCSEYLFVVCVWWCLCYIFQDRRSRERFVISSVSF